MPSSRLLSSTGVKTDMAEKGKGFYGRFPVTVQILTWLMRFAVGGLFIFSGFTKGVDVWGTIFKFHEYFSVWGYEVWDALVVSGVFLLCLLEFITGVFIFLGCFRRTAPIFALLIMAVMLPLTLWLAIANPISDCGCFGDALKLSNWATFYKNVALTLGAVWLVIYNRKAPALINPYIQWIAVVAAGLFLLLVALIGYFYQPLIDFRPYKVGTELVDHDESADSMDDAGDQYLRFVYEKNGVKKEFGIDDELPDEDDGWKFVTRYYVEGDPDMEFPSMPAPKEDSEKDDEKNIRFFSDDGFEDLTEDVIGYGRQLILMIPVLSEVNPAKTWKINSLYEWCKDNDIEMLAAVGGSPNEIKEWKDISLAEYPIYTSDDTSIKEVVRGNPGVVYVEDGIIRWKSSLAAVNIDDFQDPEVSTDPMNFARDDARILWTLSLIFVCVMIGLIILSYSPKVLMMLFRSKPRGVATHSETPVNDNEKDDE